MKPVICLRKVLSAMVTFGLLVTLIPPVQAHPVPTDIRPSFFLPPAQPSPADFSRAEAREFQRRYGIHAAQNPVNQAMTLAADTLGWRDRLALDLIRRHAAPLQTVGQQVGINPLVLAAILFDEIRHEKPTEEVLTRWGLAKTLGLAQLSLHELVMQGYFDPWIASALKQGVFDSELDVLQTETNKMSPAALRLHLHPARILAYLPADLLSASQQALLDPGFNILTLARQLVRVRRQLGISDQEYFLNLADFRIQHQLARVVVFHNGRLDYAGKILSALRLPQLEIALSGCPVHPDTQTL
jgi:hypothetical protein